MFEFAFTLKPDMTPDHIVSLARQAEAAGFAYGWIFDSHVLWQEPYPLLTLMAANTSRMRFGTCVTNPIVRDATVTASLLATLNRISGGRMDCGIGRGDSSRRVMGKKPATLDKLEETVGVIRDLTGRKQITYEGHSIQMPWADSGVPPIWVAGYGPKALRAAGRVGDGVILQFADPHLIKWCLGFVKAGCRRSWPGFLKDQGDERNCSVDFRRPKGRARARAMVSGPGLESRCRSGVALQTGGVAARTHFLYQRPQGIQLPAPRRSRQQQRRVRER